MPRKVLDHQILTKMKKQVQNYSLTIKKQMIPTFNLEVNLVFFMNKKRTRIVQMTTVVEKMMMK